MGSPSRVAAPIAGLVAVQPEAPLHYVEVSANQTTDGMYHLFQVLVELSEDRRPKPVGLLLMTDLVEDANTRSHWFRATLRGKLEKVIVISGKNDESGKAIKGSAAASEQEANAADSKVRFQHELDFWLKRLYLKKEWRSAEFAGGVLKKKGQAP